MEVLTTVDDARIRDLYGRDEFFWVDLLRPSGADLDRLGALLRLHPVALEDTHEFGQRPKMDAYHDHLLLVFFTARVTGDPSHPADPLEVHVYLSGQFVVTVRHEDCGALENLHAALVPEGTDEEDFLVYRILDSLTDAFYPVIEALEIQIDALEGDVLSRPRRDQLATTYRLKQNVHRIERLAAAQRDGFQHISDSILGLAGLSRGSKAYLRDVGDHLVQIAGELHRQNEDLLALTGTYFNANSDRLNKVATRLTVGSTLFIIWTLVTGFFGQNFGWLVSHIRSREAFLVGGVGGLVIPTVILLTLFWFKRDEWF